LAVDSSTMSQNSSLGTSDLSDDELIQERRRFQRRFRQTFWFVIGYGSFAYLCLAMGVTASRTQLPGSLMHRLSLGLSPSDGISIVGAFLGVVVAVNIALAAQDRPLNARERLRNADWTSYISLIAVFSAVSAVVICWGCWLSQARQAAWGTCIGLSLMATTSAVLAAAIQTRPRPDEAWRADEQILIERLRQLREVALTFEDNHRYPQLAWWVIATWLAGSAITVGLISATIAELTFVGLGAPLPAMLFLLLWAMAATLDAALLYYGSRVWWLVPLLSNKMAAAADLWFLASTAALAIGLAIPLLTSVPGHWKLAIALYDLSYLALPVLVIALDSHLKLLTHPCRAACGRNLESRHRDLEAELEQVRSRRSELGSDLSG
jgi:hypothetical protein